MKTSSDVRNDVMMKKGVMLQTPFVVRLIFTIWTLKFWRFAAGQNDVLTKAFARLICFITFKAAEPDARIAGSTHVRMTSDIGAFIFFHDLLAFWTRQSYPSVAVFCGMSCLCW